ncbi:MAG: DinB family protein [Acidobacteria bacterium]|nr:DinB family protein [Acidobacteriota bacterium]
MRMQALVRGLAIGTAVVTMACGSGAPPTEEMAPSEVEQAAGSETVAGDLVKDWERQKASLMAIADAMPEDRFAYKSTPAQRSYGEQIMHVAGVNVQILGLVGGTTPAPSFTAESATTKAEILQALSDSYDYGIALLHEQDAVSINGTVEAAFLGPSTRARVFWFLLGHSMDIYGQMAVYLRLNDIVPPASRGV